MTRATIYFVRHGETDWNREGRLQGAQETDLNPLGRAQAEEAARRIATLGLDLTGLAFVASPMKRTRQTMEILRASLGLDPLAYRADPAFRELAFGAWEGLTWKEIRRREPERAQARSRDKWGYVPPGGGESYAMLAERLAPGLAALTGPTVLVAHGGVARAMLHVICGLDQDQAPVTDIWQGRLLVMEDGGFRWV